MSLIEVLVTLSIVGVLFVGLTGGLFAAVSLSQVHRGYASAERVLVSWAEALKAAEYAAGCGPDCPEVYAATAAAVPNVDGFHLDLEVSCWDPGKSDFAGCAGADHRVQRLRLTVDDPGGPRPITQSVEIVKRRP